MFSAGDGERDLVTSNVQMGVLSTVAEIGGLFDQLHDRLAQISEFRPR